MNKIINVHNPREYVVDLQKSYGAKRALHTEYTDLMMVRGFEFNKTQYVKEKFPKFPKVLREAIVNMM